MRVNGQSPDAYRGIEGGVIEEVGTVYAGPNVGHEPGAIARHGTLSAHRLFIPLALFDGIYDLQVGDRVLVSVPRPGVGDVTVPAPPVPAPTPWLATAIVAYEAAA